MIATMVNKNGQKNNEVRLVEITGETVE